MATSVTLTKDPLFLAAAAITYSADEFRTIAEVIGTKGVRSAADMAVSVASLVVTVHKGRCIIYATAAGGAADDVTTGLCTNGAYLVSSPSDITLDVTTGVGMGAGKKRTDLIVARIRDVAVIGGAINSATIEVVPGTATITGGTAPAATLPAHSIELGRVEVVDGAAAGTLLGGSARAISTPPGATALVQAGTVAFTVAAGTGGIATVAGTFVTPFTAIPVVNITPLCGASSAVTDVYARLVAITTTGFTARVCHQDVSDSGVVNGTLQWQACVAS